MITPWQRQPIRANRLVVGEDHLLSQAQELHRRGNPAAAAALCREILSAAPDDARALHLLGIVMSEVGLHSEALPIFERAIAKGGAEPTLLFNYGMTLRALGNDALAARAFRLCADNNTGDADVWMALGTTRLALRQFDAAVNALQKACDLAPSRGDVREALALAQTGHALALQRARRFAEARDLTQAAVANAPRLAQAHSGLGNVLRDLGDFAGSHAAFVRAIELAPDDAEIVANQALSHLHAGDLDAAIETYARAVALAPDNEPLRSSHAQALLTAGRFAEGWAEFEHRMADPVMAARLRGLPGKRWSGEDISGRAVLLASEQGIGDTIQFARYVPVLAARGARVFLMGPSRLAHLFSSLDGLAGYITEGGPYPIADFHAPLLSIPHLLGNAPIPAPVSYLTPDPSLVAAWAGRLDTTARRIGIGWQGNRTYEMDYLRSVPPDAMTDLIRGVDADFIILQRGEAIDAMCAAGARDLGPTVDTEFAFADTAAIIANLDLVITSDTALAHLAGSLGRPTWVLLPWAPDWRFGRKVATCSWYPTMRLFRQPAPDDWAGAVAEARRALSAWLSR